MRRSISSCARIVAGLGSTWQNPPSSFYRTNRDPMTAAESVSQVFLGYSPAMCTLPQSPVRRLDPGRLLRPGGVLQQHRPQADQQRSARPTGPARDQRRRDDLPRRDAPSSSSRGPERRLQPKYPAAGPLAGSGRRKRQRARAAGDLADRDNRQFSRNLANRVWFHLLGRGIVEPVDDFRDSNPPSNPALLDAVTASFRRPRPAAQAAGCRDHEVPDLPAERDARARRTPTTSRISRTRSSSCLPAEVLLDAYQPGAGRARAIPAGAGVAASGPASGAVQGSAFLKSFGKPDRLLTCECERSEADHAGAGVPDDQRRDGQTEARVAVKPDRQAARGRVQAMPIF